MDPRGVAISIEGLACRRGERVLFENLSCRMAPGRLTEIVGPNGTGKTSLLRILAGLLKPEAGRVVLTLDGQEPDEDMQAARLLHYASHLDALKSQMTAEENLRFAGAFFGGVRDVDDALERLGLWAQADLPVAYLSAGQKRRLALARCWLLARPLWLLDEPTAALDSNGRALVGDLISAHIAEGGTVVAATHETILEDADRVALA